MAVIVTSQNLLNSPPDDHDDNKKYGNVSNYPDFY